MFVRLASWWKGRSQGRAEEQKAERGFLVFQHTGEVIQAERGLQAAGFVVEVKGPPPELRTGCDMVLTFPLMKEHAVRRVLEELDEQRELAVCDEFLRRLELLHAGRAHCVGAQ